MTNWHHVPPTIRVPGKGESPRSLGGLLGLGVADDDEDRIGRQFPLRRVRVTTRIVGDLGRTVLEQEYENVFDHALDVSYTTCLPNQGVVSAFEMRAGERFLRGECMAKGSASERMERATERGFLASLLRSERDDVQTLRLSNVPPRQGVTVRLTIDERLRVNDGRFEWRFPTTIAPKYIPGEPIGHAGDGVAPDTDRSPDASRLQPPIRLAGGTELELDILLPPHVSELSASLPLVRQDQPDGTVRVTLDGKATCDRDLVLRYWSRGSGAAARAYTDGARTLVVVDPPAVRQRDAEMPREAVYLLDCSGSMQGAKLHAAKQAVSRALRDLRSADTFQVIAFSSMCIQFRPSPVAATRSNLAAARAWLRNLAAGGGTEIVPALVAGLLPATVPGRARTVLVITDGQVGNDAEIFRVVHLADRSTRLHVVGIGMAPGAGVLDRLARLGRGKSLLLAPSEDVEAEIGRFSDALHGPIALGLRVVGEQAESPRDLFAGCSTSFFADLPEATGEGESVSVISADGRFSAQALVSRTSLPLATMWARERVRDLEDRLAMKPREAESIGKEILALGLDHQIATSMTSFVAVDESSVVNGRAVLIVQPHQLDHLGGRVSSFGRYCRHGLPGERAPGLRRSVAEVWRSASQFGMMDWGANSTLAGPLGNAPGGLPHKEAGGPSARSPELSGLEAPNASGGPNQGASEERGIHKSVADSHSCRPNGGERNARSSHGVGPSESTLPKIKRLDFIIQCEQLLHAWPGRDSARATTRRSSRSSRTAGTARANRGARNRDDRRTTAADIEWALNTLLSQVTHVDWERPLTSMVAVRWLRIAARISAMGKSDRAVRAVTQKCLSWLSSLAIGAPARAIAVAFQAMLDDTPNGPEASPDDRECRGRGGEGGPKQGHGEFDVRCPDPASGRLRSTQARDWPREEPHRSSRKGAKRKSVARPALRAEAFERLSAEFVARLPGARDADRCARSLPPLVDVSRPPSRPQ